MNEKIPVFLFKPNRTTFEDLLSKMCRRVQVFCLYVTLLCIVYVICVLCADSLTLGIPISFKFIQVRRCGI